LEALEILGNPSLTCDAVLFRLAETMDNLGAVQRDKNEPDKAERSHSGAVEIWKRLVLADPAVHLPFLARSLNSLGTVRYERNELDLAGMDFSEALEIYRKLAYPGPREFQSFLSRTLEGLAELSGFGRGTVHPGQCIGGIAEIRRRLAWISSQTYLPFVAQALNSMGAVHRGKCQLNKAEQSYLEAYKIIERLAAADPGLFGINHATTAVSLAVIYSFDILDRSRAVSYARVAINGFLPFADTCTYARKWLEVAKGILGCWESAGPETGFG
jgi:tetratricopeptide (TPR) repeat protein